MEPIKNREKDIEKERKREKRGQERAKERKIDRKKNQFTIFFEGNLETKYQNNKGQV